MILWDWAALLAEQYWPIMLTMVLMAALVLILAYLDHHDGGTP